MLTYKLELMILDGANSMNMNYTCCAANPSIDTQFKENRAHSPDPKEKDQRKKKLRRPQIYETQKAEIIAVEILNTN
jgi:hypothetical protein